MDGGAALWLPNDCEYVGIIGSNGGFGTDGFQHTSEDLAQQPQSSSVASQGVKFRAYPPPNLLQ